MVSRNDKANMFFYTMACIFERLAILRLAILIAIPDMYPRKAGGGRAPRQLGQIRKEAAPTRFGAGRLKPVFHLICPSSLCEYDLGGANINLPVSEIIKPVIIIAVTLL
jgi:hypothetical protein